MGMRSDFCLMAGDGVFVEGYHGSRFSPLILSFAFLFVSFVSIRGRLRLRRRENCRGAIMHEADAEVDGCFGIRLYCLLFRLLIRVFHGSENERGVG